jgi:hypothetical protein
VVGRGGDNVKYIQGETGCKVQIKGRNSGFLENATGAESDEPMYLHIAGPRPEGVEQAKGLCEQLLEKVRADYQSFKENASQNRFNGGGDRHGGGGGGDRYGGGGDRYSNGRPGFEDRNHSQSYGHGGYGVHPEAMQSPVAAAAPVPLASDANAQWAAYYAAQNQQAQTAQAGADPYAPYGGYEAYMQYYAYYYQQQQQQSQAAAQPSAPGVAPGSAPPPPPDSAPPGVAPPPPPPSGSPPGYSTVRTCALGAADHANYI